jgi:flagellar biosynthesis protein FliR
VLIVGLLLLLSSIGHRHVVTFVFESLPCCPVESNYFTVVSDPCVHHLFVCVY